VGTARQQRAAICPARHGELVEIVGQTETERQTEVWKAMLAVLKTGELRPIHFKGYWTGGASQPDRSARP